QASALAIIGLKPCLNYSDRLDWGTFHADTRPIGGDPIGTVTWLDDINVVPDRAGFYVWEVYINGKVLPGGGGAITKDDNLHGALPHYMNGKQVYSYGDTFHIEILHEATSGQHYAALDNRCTIAAH
ncbi:MAG TPA: hypothetical protein VE196_03230, partial [Pseudonocardiaceae bacterium]|nr:hypothetical protein [Pseudonocardiaceae bacterium]